MAHCSTHVEMAHIIILLGIGKVVPTVLLSNFDLHLFKPYNPNTVILNTDEDKNFPQGSIFDSLSYFQFKTDFFSFFCKITPNFISHKIKKQVFQKCTIRDSLSL